jgi:ADP-heptose:LPS heptosyltransferase
MWRGANTNPRNFRRRSVPLESFIKTLGDLPYQLVSLQIDPTESELELMLKAKIVSLHEDVTDFDDTAAIIEQLHCVVTVDTSVGHLCGGLGAPTVAIIPYQADWRWMLEREDSPWYPSLKLLRRSLDDADGAEVLRRARQSLLMTQA